VRFHEITFELLTTMWADRMITYPAHTVAIVPTNNIVISSAIDVNFTFTGRKF